MGRELNLQRTAEVLLLDVDEDEGAAGCGHDALLMKGSGFADGLSAPPILRSADHPHQWHECHCTMSSRRPGGEVMRVGIYAFDEITMFHLAVQIGRASCRERV